MMSSEAVLISAIELAELLRSDQLPVVADVRWNLGGPPGKPEFEAGHIPGAVWVDLETQLAGPPGAGGRHPLPTVPLFERAMREIGVCHDSLVVAYDAANSQAAARLWWLLTDAGQRHVRVLDGGLAAWRAAGLPTLSGPVRRRRVVISCTPWPTSPARCGRDQCAAWKAGRSHPGRRTHA
jgi:thiosulfate/3-mercaptopyruvate sulfurtransferase